MSYVNKATGERFPRITAVVGSNDCPYPAIIEEEELRTGKRGKRLANIASAIGTLAHSKIENFIRKEIGLPEEPYKPKATDKQLILLEKQRVKEGMPDRFKLKMDKCIPAFYDFWETYTDPDTYNLKPIHVEVRVGTGKYGMGTADLICTIRLFGRTYKFPPRHGAKSINWFEECSCKGEDCNCDYHTTITVLDWKTAMRKQKSYKTQGSAYIFCGIESGIISDSEYPINSQSWCVLLGGVVKKEKLNYILSKGSYNDGIADYFRALEIYKNPRAALKKELHGNKTIFSKCIICGYTPVCPNRVLADATDSEVDIND